MDEMTNSTLLPNKCLNLFVAGLPYQGTESLLREACHTYGELVYLKVVFINHRGYTRSYGYIQFDNLNSQTLLLRDGGLYIGNDFCPVSISFRALQRGALPITAVWELVVLGLALDTKREDLLNYFNKFGTVVYCQMSGHGVANLRFDSLVAQQRVLESSSEHKICGRVCCVDIAKESHFNSTLLEQLQTPTFSLPTGQCDGGSASMDQGGGLLSAEISQENSQQKERGNNCQGGRRGENGENSGLGEGGELQGREDSRNGGRGAGREEKEDWDLEMQTRPCFSFNWFAKNKHRLMGTKHFKAKKGWQRRERVARRTVELSAEPRSSSHAETDARPCKKPKRDTRLIEGGSRGPPSCSVSRGPPAGIPSERASHSSQLRGSRSVSGPRSSPHSGGHNGHSSERLNSSDVQQESTLPLRSSSSSSSSSSVVELAVFPAEHPPPLRTHHSVGSQVGSVLPPSTGLHMLDTSSAPQTNINPNPSGLASLVQNVAPSNMSALNATNSSLLAHPAVSAPPAPGPSCSRALLPVLNARIQADVVTNLVELRIMKNNGTMEVLLARVCNAEANSQAPAVYLELVKGK